MSILKRIFLVLTEDDMKYATSKCSLNDTIITDLEFKNNKCELVQANISNVDDEELSAKFNKWFIDQIQIHTTLYLIS